MSKVAECELFSSLTHIREEISTAQHTIPFFFFFGILPFFFLGKLSLFPITKKQFVMAHHTHQLFALIGNKKQSEQIAMCKCMAQLSGRMHLIFTTKKTNTTVAQCLQNKQLIS